MTNIVVLFNGKHISVNEYLQLITKSTKKSQITKKSSKIQNKNILINLPQDVWEHILMNKPLITIIEQCYEYPEVDKYCKLHNIIEKRKMQGFPRKSGHCAAFDASTESQNYDLDYLEGNKLENALNNILMALYKNRANLVFGDLICTTGFGDYRNTGIYIFDGIHIIELDREVDDYGALPSMFTIIKNGVPVDYWCRDDFRSSKHVVKWSGNSDQGIAHNSYVWLNLVGIRDQCINNMISETKILINGISRQIITTFKYDDTVYTIKFFDYESGESDEGDKGNENYKDSVIKTLINTENLSLEYDDDYDKETNNVLIVL